MEFIFGIIAIIVLVIILYLLNLIVYGYLSKSKEGNKTIFYKTLIQAAVLSILYFLWSFFFPPFK